MRSALLHEVANSDLLAQVGNYLESGWRIAQLLPTHELTTTPDLRGSSVRSVTHWTVVLEREVGPAITEA